MLVHPGSRPCSMPVHPTSRPRIVLEHHRSRPYHASASRIPAPHPGTSVPLHARIGRGIPNSERLLKTILDRNGVSVARVGADALPLVDGRCSPQGA